MKKRNTSLFDLADKRIEEEENTLGSRVSEQKSDLLNPTGPVVYKRYKNSGTDLFDKADSYLANVRNQEKAESDYRASLPSDADREAYDRVKASNGVYHSPYLADTTEGKEKLTFDNDDWNKLSESEKRKWLDIAEGNDRAKRYFGDVNGLDQWKLDYAKQIVNDPKDHSITNATANAANTFLGFLGKKQNVDTYNTQTFDKDREQAWMFRSLPQEIRDDLVGTVHSPSTKKYLEENYSPEEVEMFYKYGQLLGDTEEVQETRNKLEEKLSSDPFYATVVAPFQQNVSDLAQFLDAPNTMLNVANNSNAYGVVNNYQTDLQKHLAYGQYIQGSINEGLSENTLARFLYNTNMSALESTERMVLSRALAGTVTSIAPSVPYNIAAGMAMNGMMGLGVMRQEAVSLMEQGVPASKAIQTALMRGIFECAFETISLDKLGMFDEMPVVADVKTFAKNLLKAGFVEGSEEVATDLANELYDYFAAYDYSDYKQFADAYRAEHPRATDEEIWPLYNKKFAGQLVESFLGGAVSGIAMSSVQNATAWKNGQELGALGANVSDADASRMEYVVNALANAYPNVRENLQNAEEAGEVYRRGFLQKMVNSLSENYEKAIDKASNEKELNTVMENMNTNLNSVISEEAINKYNAKMVEFGKTGDINYQEFIQRRDSNPNTTFSDLAYGNGNSEISQKFREDESVINENLGNAFRGDEKAYNSIVEARNRILETRSNAEKMVENYAMLGKTLDSNEVRQFEGVLGGTERMAMAFSVGKMAGEETVKTSKVGSIASMSQEEINREFGENAANIVDYNAIRGKKNYQLAYNVGKSLTNMGINVRLYESNRNKVIPNGFYKNGTIYLDINAGVSGANAAIGETFSHELTHWIRSQNEEGYQRLLDFVKNELGDDFEKQVKRELGKLNGKDNNVAEEEVVANACAKMLQNSETFKRYAIADMTGAKKILAYLREFIANLKKAFKGSLYEQATSLISDMEGLQKEWEKALNEAIAENGMEVKAAEGIIEGNTEVAENIIGTPVVTEESQKSSQRLNDELMDAALKVAIKDGNRLGISLQMINRAIAQTKSIANRMMGDLKGFLPADNPGKVEVGNNSYGKSMENSLVCIRSIINQAYIAQVAEEVGRPLTVEEQIVASQVLQEVNSRPECNYCYVATDRQAYEAFFGSYFKQYADVYNKALAQKDELSALVKNGEKQLESGENGNALQKLYAEFLDGRSNTKPMRKRFMTWVDNAMRGNMRITEKDLASVNTRSEAKNDKAKAWMIADAESYSKSAAWPKLTNRKVKINGQNYILDYVSYNGSILKWKQDLVDKLNSEFGLRMYSFSDYVPAFLLENMQMIIDASLRGLKVLAYTKDCGFAETFADSGAGINISLFGTLDPNYKNDANITKLREEYNANKNDKTRKAYLSALDKYVVKDGVNGKEGMMGANWDRATALRKSHNNVGTVFVATNDDLVEWALANPDIDVVIPYHLVRTGDAKAAIYGYKNYKASQEDKKTKSWTSGNLKSIPPTVHGNDLETYRQALKDNNLTARFSEFADNPNYMKLVNETRMSYKELQPVKPIFDTALVNRELARIEAEGQYGLMQGFKTKEEQDAFLKSQNTVGKAVEKINGAKLSSRVSDEELEQIKAKKRTNAQDRIILRDAGEKLSEKDFYNLYSAHKLDLRGKGNVDEQVESIKNTGFRGDGGFGHNIVPASINNINRFTIDERKEYMRQFGRTEEEINEGIDRIRENGHGIWSGDTYFPEVNWTQRAYGGRKGDTVLLVPEHYTEGFSKNEDRVRVKNGFKPFDYEVVKVERDFQPYYELYSKAYDEAKARGDMGIRFSSRDSEGNELSPEQTEYFKDSKVRDAEGNLQVVYHGTGAVNGYTEFYVFEPSKWVDEVNGKTRVKGYFSENEEYARAYGQTAPYYLNIKNPLNAMDRWSRTLAGWKRWLASKGIKGVKFDSSIEMDDVKGGKYETGTEYSFYEIIDNMGYYWNGDGNVTEKIEEAGYDGICWDENGTCWVAFNRNAIKRTDNLTPTESDDIRYSTRVADMTDSELEENYMASVNGNNLDQASRIVREYAKRKGYNSPKLYHGTRFFGWTKYEEKGGYDTPFIYTTSDSTVSANYAGDNHYAAPRQIGKAFKDSYKISDIIQNAESIYGTKYRVATDSDRQAVYDAVTSEAEKINDTLNDIWQSLDVDNDIANAIDGICDAIWAASGMNDEWGKKWNEYREQKLEGIQSGIRRYAESREKLREWYGEHRNELTPEQRKFVSYLCSYEVGDALIDIEFSLTKALADGDILATENADSLTPANIGLAIPKDLQKAMYEVHNIGAYELYGNLGDNPLEFDANGSQFWALKVPQMNDDEYHGTDYVSKWAYEHGYTSVIMRNIYDYGNKADNYVFFNPSQVKSADTITYDDNGNIIPLSERFNKDSKDIRYSTRDSDGNELSTGQAEFFKDSKARDSEGNLLVLYHGTDPVKEFYEFKRGKEGYLGSGIYLTNKKSVASRYATQFGREGKIYEVYANVTNPFYVYSDTPAREILGDKEADRREKKNSYSQKWLTKKDIENLIGKGYDGIIWDYNHNGKNIEISVFNSNQIKNIDNTNPTESDDIRYSTRDSEYMQAVESGDMETAQKMVDASAKANGYTKKVYHGTRGERFNIFDFSKDQRGNDQMFFSSNRKVSETYGKNVMSLYIDTHNFLTVDANGDWWGGFDDKITKDKAQAVLDETRRVLYEKLQDAEAKTWEYKYGTEEYKKAFKEYEDAYSDWEDIRQKLTPYDDEYIYGTTYSVAKKAKEMGYDGLIIKRVIDTADENVTIPSTVYVIYDANRVKSADAVTYDNNGNIIPLSERFNKEEDDIRYAIRDIANSESEMLVNALKTDTALADDKTSRYSLELYAKEYNNLKAMENESIKLAKSLKKASPSEREVITKKILRLDIQILKATEKLTEMRTQRVLTDVLVSEWEKRLADVEWTNELTFQKTKKALEDRYGRAITGLKMKSKEQKQEIRDRYEINKRKKNIEKKTKEIMNRILHPTEKKHIPSILINPIVEMLDSIDNWTPAENRRVTKKSESMRERFINFREAVNRYQKEIDEGAELTEYMFDPEFLETVDELCESVKGIDNVNDMSVSDIVKLDQTLTELNHLIARGNKMITASHYATTNDAVSETYNELSKREDVRKAKGNLYQRLNAGMSDSYAFGQYGGAGAANIIDMLSKAFEKKILQVRQGKEFAENLLKGKDTKSWSKDKIAFRTEGGQTIELTVAQMMELYLLNNREQARGHIYGGGINIEDKKGKFRKAVKVTEEDVNNIIRYLRNVPGAIEVADALQNFGATTVTGWGNEASNLLYGISKFTDPNYWQIRSDSASLKDNANSEAQANASMFKLQNLGRTKAVKKNANNAIYIGDVFDTYAKTIDEMSSYGSILPATTDAMRWYNSSVAVDEDTRIRVKALLQNKLGTDMARVFTDTIRALNGGILGTDSLESLVKVMTGRAKAAAVAGNLRVVLQQPTAYTRAFSVIPAKYLLRALTMKPASAEAQEKSPIAWHKAQGFYSNGLAPSLRKLIVGDQTVGESITEKALWLAGKADDITWGALWNASKLMVNDTTNLQKGSDEYWKKVNEVFSDIINKTQVVDTPLTKSTWMRGNGVGIYFTAFMAEPTKTYSMVSTAIDRVIQHPHSAEAKKALAIAGFTFGLNAIVNAFAQAIADAARDDDKEKDYFEKFREQWQEDVVDNLNPLTYVPVVKDAWSAINGYSSSRLDLQAIQNSVYAMNELKKIASGKSTKTLFGQVEQVSKAVSSWTGIPVSNVMRTMNSFGNLMGIDAFRRKKYTNTELARNIALSVDAGNAEDVEKYTKELSENLARSNSSRSVDDYVSDYLADHSEKIDEWAERYYDDPTTLNDAIADMSEWYSPDVVVSAIKKSINHDAGDDKSQKVSTSTAAGTIYNGGDINRMLKKGDIATAQEIIDTMQDGYAEMGSSASPKTQITSYWKPIYQSASLQEKENIRKMLYKLSYKGKQMYSAKDFEKWK